MAWNKPNDDGRARSHSAPWRRAGAARPTISVRGLIAGLIVAIGAAVAAWWFWPDSTIDQDTSAENRKYRIKEACPASAPTNVVVAPPPQKKFWEVDESQTNGFTKGMQRKWEIMHRPKMEVQKRERKVERYEIFKYRSENMIASLLCSKPGQSMIGRPRYTGLTADFLKSCQEPIIITKDDDEFTADLKRQMNEVKIELKPRIDAGEDLGDIIEKSREEFRQLAEYKRMLERELRGKIKKGEEQREDVEDFQKAVNIMLEKKGIAPVKLSPIALSRLKQMKGKDL